MDQSRLPTGARTLFVQEMILENMYAGKPIMIDDFLNAMSSLVVNRTNIFMIVTFVMLYNW